MEYVLVPSYFFLEQLEKISPETKELIHEKLQLAKLNPFRYKRIKGCSLFLFRIRMKENRKEKRIIYLLDKNLIKILCILDRDNNYKDLKLYLKKLGYL